ncbi:HNH endonuclease [Deinococcus sp. MIMF12]|uniref:HNH endonuclease n=1 Tax=Deinococcus rhizophilus TaxID=3049544 RepID=A0ABT7JDJ4_9DEIO|nr:HNH endonuclease [Deinococcus rhizophilus]MDL2343016.1 HNH endonuclease [Deinococcus rhizophilus]
MKKRKPYAKVKCKRSGKRVLLHRQLVEEHLGRPLLPGEIVHHRDGDSTNNALENLIVLPSQRYHAHIEYHLRREKLGMPSLFPEFLQGVKLETHGTLFGNVCALPVKEPPPMRRPRSRR